MTVFLCDALNLQPAISHLTLLVVCGAEAVGDRRVVDDDSDGRRVDAGDRGKGAIWEEDVGDGLGAAAWDGDGFGLDVGSLDFRCMDCLEGAVGKVSSSNGTNVYE